MFMQVMKAKAKDEAGVRKAIDRWETDIKPGAAGYLGATLGFLDDGTFIVAARFESTDAAKRNSDRPEQGEWFEEISSHFDGEPEFYDIEDAQTFLDGGSDDAGFVQVMIGHSPDRDKLQQSASEGTEELRKARPDIIGGVMGGFGDDGFVNVAYFTSEAEARKGEASEPQSEGAEQAEEFQRLMGDVKFYDIKNPTFYSGR